MDFNSRKPSSNFSHFLHFSSRRYRKRYAIGRKKDKKTPSDPNFSESVLVKINKMWDRHRLFFAFHRNFA